MTSDHKNSERAVLLVSEDRPFAMYLSSLMEACAFRDGAVEESISWLRTCIKEGITIGLEMSLAKVVCYATGEAGDDLLETIQLTVDSSDYWIYIERLLDSYDYLRSLSERSYITGILIPEELYTSSLTRMAGCAAEALYLLSKDL